MIKTINGFAINIFSRIDSNEDLQKLFAQMIDLDRSHFPAPWTKLQWEDLILRPSSYLAIQMDTDTDRIIGFSYFDVSRLESMSHLYKIVVDPMCRGQGRAKDLLKISEIDFKPLEIASIYLEVAVNNNQALKLYESMGFKKLNRIKRFYSDGTDAFAMQKTLSY